MAFSRDETEPTMAPFNDSLLGFARDLALYRPMVTRGFFLILGFPAHRRGAFAAPLRTRQAGVVRQHGAARSEARGVGEHPANGFVASYLAFVSHHTGLFARLVVLARSGSARS